MAARIDNDLVDRVIVSEKLQKPRHHVRHHALRMVHFLASFAKPTWLVLVGNFVQIAITAAHENSRVFGADDCCNGNVVSADDEYRLVHQLHLIVRVGCAQRNRLVTECHSQDNNFDGRGEDEQILYICHENTGLWFD